MASNAPKSTDDAAATDDVDTTPAPAETAAAESTADATSDAPTPNGGNGLSASVAGNLITLTGTGFESGQKYDVRFQRPDGSIDNTIAIAQEDGSLATYATVKGTGKHEAWLEVLGKKIAGLKFKV